MVARIAPDLDDQVAETVEDLGVLMETGRRLHVANRPQPLRHPVEVAELLLERGDDRKARQPRRPIALLHRQIPADDALDEDR